MSRFLSIIWHWFCAVGRCANRQPETQEQALRRRWHEDGDTEAFGQLLRMYFLVDSSPGVPVANLASPAGDVGGNAVSIHVATGPRLSHDVPTLPLEPFPHPSAGQPLFYTT